MHRGSGYNREYELSEKGRMNMIKGLSHIAIRVKDLDESLRFYREILGLEEAFRLREEDGTTRIVYLWIAPGQFIELFPNGGTEPERGSHMIGMQHICLETGDVEAALKKFADLGVSTDTEVMTGKAKCRQFWVHDPDGNPIEVMELGPKSMQAQAAKRFAERNEQG